MTPLRRSLEFRSTSKSLIYITNIRNSKIPRGQTEIVKSGDRQDHGQQNERKDKYRTHNNTLTTKAGVTQTLQKSR